VIGLQVTAAQAVEGLVGPGAEAVGHAGHAGVRRGTRADVDRAAAVGPQRDDHDPPEGSVVDATSRAAPPPARRAERTARTPYIVPVRTLERRLPDHWPASCVVVVSWPTVNAKGA
jgi:hypothetical protein